MKDDRPLSRRWVRFRRTRYAAYLGEGLGANIAWQLAKVETAARRRIAVIIGPRAAESANIVGSIVADRPRFYLTGPVDGLDERQWQRLRDELGAKFAVL